jgi:hypothetical protein
MKKLIVISLLCHSFLIHAQDCSGYYFLKEKNRVEVSLYNKKGADNGKHVYTVTSVTNTGTGASSVLNSESFNKDGKSIATAVENIQCLGGVMMLDMKMNMNLSDAQQKQFSSSTVTGDKMYIDYPSSMKVGDDLKDAHMVLNMMNNGMEQTVEVNITQRKVVAKESITSPAGTWDCFKITFNTKTKVTIMNIGIPVSMDVTEWYCPGFGQVKTETKHGSSLVTSVSVKS